MQSGLAVTVPSVSDAVIQYGGFLKARNMSTSTQTQTDIVLRHLYRITGDIPVGDIEAHHIDDLFANRTWAQGTRNNYLQLINNFMGWCRTHKYMPLDYNPAGHWETRKVVKRNKTWLTLPLLSNLITGAHPRDRAFMAVGIFTFLRASELTTIRIKDINLVTNEIDVYRIKTKQEDRLPICLELRDELVLWLTYYDKQNGPLNPDWFLLPARGPQPMTGVIGERRLIRDTTREIPLKPTVEITSPRLIVQRAMKRTGLEVKRGDGCHILRRSGARNLFEQLRSQGHDGAARRVQSMLGHSSVVITEGYLGIDYERRQRNKSLSGQSMFPLATEATAIEGMLAIES